MKMSKGTIGYISTFIASILSIPVWVSEHAMELGTLFFVGISAIFGCVHYYKSWKLKDVERELKLRELYGEDVYMKYKGNGKKTD